MMAFMLNLQKQVEEMIRNCGERVTSGRVQVLALLLAQQKALTHHEIEERLRGKHELDRVTLYRVLEWLNKKGFVHKVVSDDRVWRFHGNTHFSQSDQHAHFECIRCTSVICLDDIKAEYNYPLPAGYQFREIELTVKGLCAACT
jgi:Fur family transcriptional regulator, ferric uptake regulator